MKKETKKSYMLIDLKTNKQKLITAKQMEKFAKSGDLYNDRYSWRLVIDKDHSKRKKLKRRK